MQCIKCNGAIQEGRLKALPSTKTCTECSTIEQVGCVDITYHKTGNTIQVMDKASADKINKLARRGNFGIMTGMKGGSGGATKTKLSGSVKVWPIPTDEDYQVALKKIGMMIDMYDRSKCIEYIEDQYHYKLINATHAFNLRTIVDTLLPTIKQVAVSRQEVDIDPEIAYAFKNWKNTKVYK